MSVYQNLTGTTSKTFKIGKSGITLDSSDNILKLSNNDSATDLLLNKIYFGDTSTYISNSEYTGNATTATKLKTPVKLNITGAAVGSATNIDMSSDINIAITSLDASKLSSGDISWDRIKSHVVATGIYTGSENKLARSDHSHENMVLTNISNTFTTTQKIQAAVKTDSELDIIAQNANSILLMKQQNSSGVDQNITHVTVDSSNTTIGTSTNTPIYIATNKTNRVLIDTDGYVKSTSNIGSDVTDNSFVTAKWVLGKNYTVSGHTHAEYVSDVTLDTNGSPSTTTSNKLLVTKNNKATTITIDNVEHASNINGGTTNGILYQLEASRTGTISAPVVSSTDASTKASYILQYDATETTPTFNWKKESELTTALAQSATYATYIGTNTKNYSYNDISTNFSSMNTKLNNHATSLNNLSASVLNITDNLVESISLNGTSYTVSNNTISLPDLAVKQHTHTISDVADLSTSLSKKSDVGHIHGISDITNLSASLSTITTNIASINSALSNKSNVGHTHEISNVNGLSDKLTDLENSITNQISKIPVASSTTDGLMTSTNFTKLSNIADNATKVEVTTNGHIKINDVDKIVYELPVATSTTLGGVKVDSIISSTSTNPVENKAIKTYIDNKNTFEDLTVNGNLIVKGNTTTLETSNLSVKDALIEVAKRDTISALSGYAGIYVNHYDGTENKAEAIVMSSTGKAYFGTASVSSNGTFTSSDFKEIALLNSTLANNANKVLVYDGGIKQSDILNSYVPTTRTIAGLPLSANIDKAALQSSLGLKSAAYQESTAFLSATGTAADSNKLNGKIESALSVSHASTATNISNGAKYQIPYQSAANSTTFISVPTTTSTVLRYCGNATNPFEWIDPTTIKVTNAVNADVATNISTVAVNTDVSKSYYLSVLGSTTGDQSLNSVAGITVNPNTKSLSATSYKIIATTFSGSLDGEATNAKTANKSSALAGGTQYQIPYQSAANSTTFISAPTSKNTVLRYCGNTTSPFEWIDPTTIKVNNASTAETATRANEIAISQSTGTLYVGGFASSVSSNSQKAYVNSAISMSNGVFTVGNDTTSGNIILKNISNSTVYANLIKPAAANTTITLPSSTGTLALQSELSPKANKSGDTFTGQLKIYTTTPQLILSSASTGTVAKTSELSAVDYSGNISSIFKTAYNSAGATFTLGSFKTISLGKININDDITISANMNPSSTDVYNLGSSSLNFNNIYGKTIYENGTSLSKKYVNSVSTNSTSGYISNISISNGTLILTKGTPSNTDTKVTAALFTGTTNKFTPLLLGPSGLATATSTAMSSQNKSVTDTVYYQNTIYADAGEGNLYANKFIGSFSGNLTGNASTATTATNVNLNAISASSTGTKYHIALTPDVNSSTSAALTSGSDITITRTNVNDNVTKTIDASGYTISANIGSFKSISASSINATTISATTVSATTFSGNLSGNASSATTAGTASTATNANNVKITATGDTSNTKYFALIDTNTNSTGKTLYTTNTGLSVKGSTITGNLNGNADSATKANTVALNTFASNTTYYIPLATNTPSDPTAFTASTSFSVNTNTSNKVVSFNGYTISATTFSGNLNGIANRAKDATTATHIANGAANKLLYQTASSSTSFISAWETSQAYDQLLVVESTTSIPTWKKSPYLKSSGDTMTGRLQLNKGIQSVNTGALDANDSNIINVNSLYVGSSSYNANTGARAINFVKSVSGTTTTLNQIYFDANNNLLVATNTITNENATTNPRIVLTNKNVNLSATNGTITLSAGGSNFTTTINNVSNASTVSTTAAASSKSYYLSVLGSTTGNQSLNSVGGITINPNTKALSAAGYIITATTFSGDLTGTATKANNIYTQSGTSDKSRHVFFSHSDNDTQVVYNDNFMYNPAMALLTVSGVTIDGKNKTITATTFSGKATSAGTADSAASVTTTVTTASTTHYLPVLSGVSGNQSLKAVEGITIIPSTKTIIAPAFSGTLTGKATSAGTADSATTAATASSANTVNVSFTTTNADTYYLPIINSTSNGYKTIYGVAGIKVNPNTNTITASTFKGKATSAESATNATNVYVTSTTTNADYYVAAVSTSATGNKLIYNATGIKVNPCTNTITATNLSVTNNATVSKDLLVQGNLTVNGEVTSVQTTNLAIKDTLLELGKGRGTSALTTYAGFYVEKYDGTNSGALVFDSTGTAYVGDVEVSNGTISVINSSATNSATSLQPLATRSSSLTGGKVLIWDATNKTIINASNLEDKKYIDSISVANSTITWTGSSATINNVENATNATNVMVTATNSNATYYMTGVASSSSSKQSVYSNSGISFNPSTRNVNATGYTITATTFSGKATSAGTADSATKANTASVATSVTTTATTANSTHYLPVLSSTSGNQSLKVVEGITINPSTKTIIATAFSGTLTGKATSAGTADSASTATNANNVKITVASTTTSAEYYLTAVNASSAGNKSMYSISGVKVNPNTNTITATTFSGKATSAGTADSATKANTASVATSVTTTATTANSTHYLPVLSGTSGDQSLKAATGITVNPSTKTITGKITHVATQNGDSNASRHVFFAFSGDDTQIVYNNNFMYNPATAVLTVSGMTIDGKNKTINGTATAANNLVATTAFPSGTATNAYAMVNYANSQLRAYDTSGNYKGINFGTDPAIISGTATGGSSVKLLTATNYTAYAANSVTIKNGNAGSATSFFSTGNLTVDISKILPTAASFNSSFVTIATSQNVPAKKSFGSGITIGSDTSGTAYNSTGCTMQYNKDKQCVQFIFA